jgi:hypothetical protein
MVSSRGVCVLANGVSSCAAIDGDVSGLVAPEGTASLAGCREGACVCTAAGEVVCAQASTGRCALPVMPWTPVNVRVPGQCVSVGCGAQNCMLTPSGAVWCWPRISSTATPSEVLTPPAPSLEVEGETSSGCVPEGIVENIGVRDARAIAVGDRHACAIVGEARDLYCWGGNARGECSDGPGVDGVVRVGMSGVDLVAVGGAGTCATVRGEPWCWGALAGLPTPSELAACVAASPARIPPRSDPIPLADPACRHGTPRRIDGVPALRQLAVGATRACGLTEGGELWCWGVEHGGARLFPREPLRVAEHIVGFGVAEDDGCALDADAQLWCWGSASTWTRDAQDIVSEPPGRLVGRIANGSVELFRAR